MGAAAGAIAERRLVDRPRRPRRPLDAPLGALRGTPVTVRTADGVDLHVEVDEARAAAPTVIFVHGYALNLDCWHYQRLALRGYRRTVFYDQRSHGRSGRSERELSTIEQLGEDLLQVIETVAPEGPLVLVGHSMGGMTIMALAHAHPEIFTDRVVAVSLISTSAGDLGAVRLGLPGLPGRAALRLTPGVVATLARAPRLVESGRRAGSDLGYLLTARYAFGGAVDSALVDFTDQMLAGTPVSVVADFFPDFAVYEQYDALKALYDIHTLVVCGTRDAITPVQHSRKLRELLPSAELCELEGAGHMVILERADEVNRALADLLRRADAEAHQ
ncbi:MAG: alpha/beta fold hydrolase [Propionibacteriales bacterium]|nr:alpha/beta fold hydrolase [Propionibacteriales bacterium]